MKQRFIKVNHDFNNAQEQLIMASAELESIKNSKKVKSINFYYWFKLQKEVSSTTSTTVTRG